MSVHVLRPTVLALGFLVACDRKEAATEARDSGPAPVKSAPAVVNLDAGAARAEPVEVPEVRIRPAVETTVRLDWLTPSGTTVNDDAPFRVRWNRSDGLAEAPSDVKLTGNAVKDGFRVKVRPNAGTPNATLGGEISIVVCDAVEHSICLPVRRTVEIGFVVTKDAAGTETTVSIPLPAAR